MDIKDWILVGGGLVLATVIGHGFWLAWRAGRDPLKIAIDPNIPKEPEDPLWEVRGELPNGGARVLKEQPTEQAAIDFGGTTTAPHKHKEPIVGKKPLTARRNQKPGPIVATRERARTAPEVCAPGSRADGTVEALPAHPKPASRAAPAPKPVQSEVIIINVLARNGVAFGGTDLMEAFLRNGLKFGEMNIFHRIDPASKITQFSVASAVEPGTFDLSSMDVFRTPGVSFFMRLPGPDEPLDVFEDMLTVSRDVAASLGADLKDEHQSVMTSQTIAHCRARIEDFSRKRMSQRVG